MKINSKNKEFDPSKFYSELPYPKKVAELIDENVVFNFTEGIPAFESAKRFVLLLNEKIKPFLYLKSIDVEDLGFVCVDPFIVKKGYLVNLPAKDRSMLELKEPSSAFVLSIVTVAPDPKEITANLMAPIIFNIDTFTGLQVILDDSYPVRYKIWEGLNAFNSSDPE